MRADRNLSDTTEQLDARLVYGHLVELNDYGRPATRLQ